MLEIVLMLIAAYCALNYAGIMCACLWVRGERRKRERGWARGKVIGRDEGEERERAECYKIYSGNRLTYLKKTACSPELNATPYILCPGLTLALYCRSEN